MAAVTRPARFQVRAAALGEGKAIATLWRELWEAHEAWGGYAGSRDPRIYAQLARRLDDDARVRAGQPILGRHVHLVADLDGVVCGQVEGWFDRHGANPTTPFTCEVRSLVVTRPSRRFGAGRALLEHLACSARLLSRGAPCVLAAEVLEQNPAHPFYARIGYSTVCHSARIEADRGAALLPGTFAARSAMPSDAPSVARLEATLAARRRAYGDPRFDRPRALDASMLESIAERLTGDTALSLREPVVLAAADSVGHVRGAANFAVHELEPPFVPMRRALVGRFALDPAYPALPLVAALVALACKLALTRGASQVELMDLTPPGTELHDAVVATGARAWARVVTKYA